MLTGCILWIVNGVGLGLWYWWCWNWEFIVWEISVSSHSLFSFKQCVTFLMLS